MIPLPLTEAAAQLRTAVSSQLSQAQLVAASGIDRDTGREWVERELSKSEYAANDLTPLEQIGRWLSSLWDSLVRAALGANSPWLLIFVVLGLAAIIALIVWRVRRAGFRRVGVPLSAFDPVVSLPEPGPWRESAARAARAGDFETAVIDESRAIFAVLSVKQIVSLESSATASELAHAAEAALPEHGPAVHSVAEVFNDLRYGEESARSARVDRDLGEVYADLCALDRSLSSLPVHRQEAPA
ncbi:DUF4129 domain-containing protein [Brevibacterium spongiae]|uniref:DUF4129 domain-containing protein n=1 Tax=Brevibacterium spongiae TaxID=2909672 RepID=A0ABY5ST98_9MICO|nr:DUF4129 domain-containing protein [Brevibacterium spongiae]UVI37424.1 DUF4129 domain-containing protein [Brevibacterium spongiae]